MSFSANLTMNERDVGQKNMRLSGLIILILFLAGCESIPFEAYKVESEQTFFVEGNAETTLLAPGSGGEGLFPGAAGTAPQSPRCVTS